MASNSQPTSRQRTLQVRPWQPTQLGSLFSACCANVNGTFENRRDPPSPRFPHRTLIGRLGRPLTRPAPRAAKSITYGSRSTDPSLVCEVSTKQCKPGTCPLSPLPASPARSATTPHVRPGISIFTPPRPVPRVGPYIRGLGRVRRRPHRSPHVHLQTAGRAVTCKKEKRKEEQEKQVGPGAPPVRSPVRPVAYSRCDAMRPYLRQPKRPNPTVHRRQPMDGRDTTVAAAMLHSAMPTSSRRPWYYVKLPTSGLVSGWAGLS